LYIECDRREDDRYAKERIAEIKDELNKRDEQ